MPGVTAAAAAGSRTSSEAITDLADRLRLAVTRLARLLRKNSTIGASPTQLSALATIERHGPITLGELAAHEGVQPPTITAAVGRLEEQGLVARQPDPDDGRVSRVVVTSEGRKLLARNRSRKTAFLVPRIAALDAEERKQLAAAVDVIDRLLEIETRPGGSRR